MTLGCLVFDEIAVLHVIASLVLPDHSMEIRVLLLRDRSIPRDPEQTVLVVGSSQVVEQPVHDPAQIESASMVRDVHADHGVIVSYTHATPLLWICRVHHDVAHEL